MNNAQSVTFLIALLLLAAEHSEAAAAQEKGVRMDASNHGATVPLHLDYKAEPTLPPQDTRIEVPTA